MTDPQCAAGRQLTGMDDADSRPEFQFPCDRLPAVVIRVGVEPEHVAQVGGPDTFDLHVCTYHADLLESAGVCIDRPDT